jgi:hypothetical protein
MAGWMCIASCTPVYAASAYIAWSAPSATEDLRLLNDSGIKAIDVAGRTLHAKMLLAAESPR